MPHRTLSLEQAAEHLHLSAQELERLVQDQAIPFQRRGRRVVFRKADIESWASERILSADAERLTEYHRRTAEPATPARRMLPELLRPEWIAPALTARTRASVIREMAGLAARTGWVNDPAELVESLEAREALCSTAVPGGVAFLHPRVQQPWRFERSFLVLGRTVQAIHFGAPDQQPTQLFFLLCSQDDTAHLHLLARLCLLAQRTGLIEAVRVAPDAEAMCDAILAAEAEALR